MLLKIYPDFMHARYPLSYTLVMLFLPRKFIVIDATGFLEGGSSCATDTDILGLRSLCPTWLAVF